MKQLMSAAVAAVVVGISGSAQASVSDAEWEQFKSQFADMASRVQALEAENAALKQQDTLPLENLSQLQSDVATL